MEKKILLVCDQFATPDSANSICVRNIAECMIKLNLEVWVVCRGKAKSQLSYIRNGVNVVELKRDKITSIFNYLEGKNSWFYKAVLSLFQISRYLFVVWFYPKGTPYETYLYYKTSKRLIEDNGIKVVVAFYRPYVAIDVAVKLKREFKSNLELVTYHLDLLSSPNNKSGFVKKIKQKLQKKSLQREFGTADRILLPESAPQCNFSNIEYVDFPLFLPLSDKVAYNIDRFDFKNKIHIGMAGSLDKSNRNPIYICSLLNQLPLIKGKEIVVHLWGRMTGVDLSNMDRIIHHGICSNEEVVGHLFSCDFLLNIGNEVTYQMLPSKVFQMFSLKKPIIFCVNHPLDASIPYFEKYNHTCFVSKYLNKPEEDVKRLCSFIEEYYLHQISINDDLFIKSTPEYICKRIMGS